MITEKQILDLTDDFLKGSLRKDESEALCKHLLKNKHLIEQYAVLRECSKKQLTKKIKKGDVLESKKLARKSMMLSFGMTSILIFLAFYYLPIFLKDKNTSNQTMIENQSGSLQIEDTLTAPILIDEVEDLNEEIQTPPPVVVNPCANIKINVEYSVSKTCAGASNGAVNIKNMSGGKAPYITILRKNHGAKVGLSGLAEGIYNLKVKDSQGCARDEQVIITSKNCVEEPVINQPPPTSDDIPLDVPVVEMETEVLESDSL